MLNISPEQQAQVNQAAFIEYLGGAETVEMLVLSQIDRVSLREIARRFGSDDEPMNHMDVKRSIVKAAIKLRKLKRLTEIPLALPEQWPAQAAAAGPS